jgi:hypothetical protein
MRESMTVPQIMKATGLSKASIYRALRLGASKSPCRNTMPGPGALADQGLDCYGDRQVAAVRNYQRVDGVPAGCVFDAIADCSTLFQRMLNCCHSWESAYSGR